MQIIIVQVQRVVFDEDNNNYYSITGHCCVYDTVECLIEPYGFL